MNSEEIIKQAKELQEAREQFKTQEEQTAFMAGVIWQQNKQFKEMEF